MSMLTMSESLQEAIINQLLEKLKYKPEEVKKDTKISKLENKKKRLKFMFIETQEISDAEYTKEIKLINEELEATRNEDKEIPTNYSKAHIIKETKNFLKDFNNFWNKKLDKENKRKWIIASIAKIWVDKQNIIAIEPREEFTGLFNIMKKVIVQAPLATPFSI